MIRRIALLCAPFRTRTPEEAAELERVKARLVVRGWVPIFLPDTLAGVLDDEDETERRVALSCSESFVARMARVEGVSLVVVGERMTEGMQGEASAWLDAGGSAPLAYEHVGFAGEQGEGR